MQQVLFEEGTIESPLILLRNPMSLEGRPATLMVEPFRVKLEGRTAWRCDLAWMSGLIVLDRRGAPIHLGEFDASKRVIAKVVSLTNWIDVTKSSLQQLLSQHYKGKR